MNITLHRKLASLTYIFYSSDIAYFFKCFYVQSCYVDENILYSKQKTISLDAEMATLCLSSWLFYWQYFCRLYEWGVLLLRDYGWWKSFGIENIHTKFDFIASRHTLWLKGILCINLVVGNCCFIELNPLHE